jgi:membrane protease YdiL (CAAX protease family)
LSTNGVSLRAVWGTVILAAGLWFVAFYLLWGIFWIKIAVSAALLAYLGRMLDRTHRPRLRIDAQSIIVGALLATLLYGIFWLGKIISTALFPFAQQQIGAIYGKGEGTPVWVITLLLFFVTGPCEELYWRGYLQRNLVRRFGGWQGWLLATACYAGVHIWSMNFMLIGAAAVAGAFWGLMYWRLGDLRPVIVSHALWSTVIFAALPVP